MSDKIISTSNYVEQDNKLYKITNYESKDGNVTYYGYYVEEFVKVGE